MEFPSKSNPGKSYHIIQPNAGGDLYCDCWTWKRTRTCSHLAAYYKMQEDKQSGEEEPKEISLLQEIVANEVATIQKR